MSLIFIDWEITLACVPSGLLGISCLQHTCLFHLLWLSSRRSTPSLQRSGYLCGCMYSARTYFCEFQCGRKALVPMETDEQINIAQLCDLIIVSVIYYFQSPTPPTLLFPMPSFHRHLLVRTKLHMTSTQHTKYLNTSERLVSARCTYLHMCTRRMISCDVTSCRMKLKLPLMNSKLTACSSRR